MTALKRHRQEGYETPDGAFWIRRYGSAWAVYDKRSSDLYGGALMQIVVTLSQAKQAIESARGIRAGLKSKRHTTPTEPGAEEYAIHDHENFGGYHVGEYEDIEALAKLGAAIEEHGTLIPELMSHLGLKDVGEALEYMEENYGGTWRTLEDFAEEFLSDTGALSEMPENLRSYFDFEKYARDMELGGDVFTLEGGDGIHVFWNR